VGPTWEREIILFDVDGLNVRQITDGGNNLAPSFSPDGQWLAFTSYRDLYQDPHGCEIYIMRVDGSQITRLTANDYCDWQPRWGP
jgi:TolB protein